MPDGCEVIEATPVCRPHRTRRPRAESTSSAPSKVRRL